MRRRKTRVLWLLAAVAITMISLITVFGASQPRAMAAQQSPMLPDLPALKIPADGSQIFNDNLVVERGQVLDGDVTVLSGNAKVESGGEIRGNLIVMSGNVKIEENAIVHGDVTAFSGNVKVEGQVHGDVSSVSGNVDLEDESHVQGDVSVISGNIDRKDGARLDGSTFHGPNIGLPFAGETFRAIIETETKNEETVDVRHGTSIGERIGFFILRLIGATLFTAGVAAFCGVAMAARPTLIASTTTAIRRETAMNFVAGLIANLSLLFLMGMLAVTFCLLPVALVPLAVLLLANALGWASVSNIVGQRIADRANLSLRPAATVALGAIVLTGPASLLWAFGGCFRAIMFIGVLAISSVGSGAVILPWLRRLSTGKPQSPAPTGSGGASASSASATSDSAHAANVDANDTVATTSVVDAAAEDVAPATAYSASTAGADEDAPTDFTLLRGIGPVANLRLQEAGVTSFAELAAMTAEQIGEILGWSAARVERNELLAQAQQFAAA